MNTFLMKRVSVGLIIAVLVAALLFFIGGFIGPAAAIDDSVASTANPTVDNTQNPDAVYVEPAVRNASGDVELMLYLDSLSTSELMAADDPIERMQSHSRSIQPEVRFVLEQRSGVEIKSSSWLANSLLISVDLSQQSVDTLASIDGVERIGENAEITALETINKQNTIREPLTHDVGYTYGLEQIDAPTAWEMYDTRGEGVRVAVIDTGIDATHPDIDLFTEDSDDPTYPGGWAEFDRNGVRVEDSTPYDTGQHGTHVSGTVAGGNASGTHIGVAPDAELMHALGIDASDGGTTAQLIASVEWAILNDADVVSLSLGASGAVPSDVTWVRNAKATGVHVVAASGNAGVGTTSSPAVVHDSIAVGASDQNRDIASFSSGDSVDTVSVWGTMAPKGWPDSYVVPTVTAPGVGVTSTVPDNSYSQSSGTSMATPHVSGALALLIAASDEQNLTPTAYERALTDSATKPESAPETQDVRYGHGIINVTAAVERLAAYDGGVHGTVTDTRGEPISGADVKTAAGVRTVTDDSGAYRLNSTSGETIVTATAFGYETQTRSTTVPESGGATENFELEQTVEATVTSDMPRFAESGDSYSGTLQIGNADSYTVSIADDSTVDPEMIDIEFGGITVEPNEQVEFDETISRDLVSVTVDTDESITNETLTLKHLFKGVDNSKTVQTAQTTIKSDLAPAQFDITAFDAPERVAEDGTVPINATVENTGERTDKQPIAYRVVGSETDVSTEVQTVELAPAETEHIQLDIDISTLDSGEYVQSVESEDDSSERPLTVVEKRTISLALDPTEVEAVTETQHTFDLVVSDPFSGISSYDVTVSTNNSNVARIIAAEPDRNSGSGSETVAENGSTVQLERTLDTDPYTSTDEVTIGTVIVESDDVGNATLSITADSELFDLDSNPYTVRMSESSTITVVSSPTGVDVTGDGVVATDTTGDGRLNDINGDGRFTIADVQLFFENRNNDVIQNNVSLFDFSGNGAIGVSDVQVLFEQLQAQN